MKKFLLSLAVLAMATPAWAISIADWALTPIVSGSVTYTLNSFSGLGDPGIDVTVVDNGFVHSLNLAGLGNTANNFALNFTVSVNSGPSSIIQTRVSQNDVLGNTTAGTITVTTPDGVFPDVILGSGIGADIPHPVITSAVTWDVESFEVNGTNFLSNMTFDAQQGGMCLPEPSTFVLSGLAVVGLVVARRRAR